MKEKLNNLRSEKKYKAKIKPKGLIWRAIRAFKKGYKIQQRNCIRFIKKVVRGWFK